MNKALYEAIATLLGVTIGAGIFGIPYVFAKAGFLTGLVTLLIVVLFMSLTNLYLGEITLRTKGLHQLTGYASIYLGKTGKFFMTLSMVFGIYGALIAYIIGSGESIGAILNVNPAIGSLGFFIVLAALLFFGLRSVERSELFIGLLKASFFIIIILLLISSTKFNLQNLNGFNITKIFIPYGVIFFAYLATAVIPEMREELLGKEKYLKSGIIIGGLISIVTYILFALAIVSVSGNTTTEVATLGLKSIGGLVFVIANLFVVFAMATAFLALSLALVDMYVYDYKINKNLAWFITCFIPIALFFLGIKNFIETISITGAFSGGLVGILIILMAERAKRFGNRKPEYSVSVNKIISFILILIFVLGIIYSVI